MKYKQNVHQEIYTYHGVIMECSIKNLPVFADRFVLHDQPLPGRNRNAVLGDKEEGDGENAAGASAVPFDLDTRVVHEYLRAYYLLCRNCQVGTRRCRGQRMNYSRELDYPSVIPVYPRKSRSRIAPADDPDVFFSRYIAHLWRRGKRRLMKRYRLYLYRRQQKREQNLLKEQQSQTFRSSTATGGSNRVPGGEYLPFFSIMRYGVGILLGNMMRKG